MMIREGIVGNDKDIERMTESNTGWKERDVQEYEEK